MLFLTCLRRTRWAVSVLALVSAPVLASPEAADPVSHFLHEKGLVQASHAGAPGAPVSDEDKKGLMAQVRDTASGMVLTAMNFLGVPYRRGGESAEEGFDCSGFTRHIFERSLGLVLPRRADDQARAPGLIKISREDLKPGDLVFFNTLRATFSHVGIYIGEGKFIHSPRSGATVRIEDMRIAYWTKRFTGARRPSALDPSAAQAAGATLPTGAAMAPYPEMRQP
ncbi:C40 family peptidase [Aquabacterium sp. A7-Y]|uniref:C40 family peptidase n=1 Tax=Aquabacterium sp. A7-Y TaxID=1349605 RepID=UPI00223DDA5D|nr:C40 family peptidase [Aquabacterium sp. A7-Y]MCW7540373.1 C40 family peptidase [Aquabacterium sp. A7-Y]